MNVLLLLDMEYRLNWESVLIYGVENYINTVIYVILRHFLEMLFDFN